MDEGRSLSGCVSSSLARALALGCPPAQSGRQLSALLGEDEVASQGQVVAPYFLRAPADGETEGGDVQILGLKKIHSFYQSPSGSSAGPLLSEISPRPPTFGSEFASKCQV